MTARRYPFEGELRTVAEILTMMPVYSERSVRGYLADENPPTTRAEMHEMARRRAAASRAALMANAQANKVYFATKKPST